MQIERHSYDLARLTHLVDSLVSTPESPDDWFQARLFVFSLLSELSVELLAVEKHGVPRTEILGIMDVLRTRVRSSPFLDRIQCWPRGYPGDFETVEYLVEGENKAARRTFCRLVEEYFLRSPTAQQHRNKLSFQASAILDTLQKTSGNARILGLAAGSALDFQLCCSQFGGANPQVILNDTDPVGLRKGQQAIEQYCGEVAVIPGNAVKCVANLLKCGSRFDIVIAGGLFDYLPDKWVLNLVERIVPNLLTSKGRFVFTNIAKGNPLRLLMEYLCEWPLIERVEEDYLRLTSCVASGGSTFSVTRDQTDLALLMSVERNV